LVGFIALVIQLVSVIFIFESLEFDLRMTSKVTRLIDGFD